MTRYQHLASLLAERIEQGLYRPGEKLPSVRSLSQEHGVSISTVQQAYQTLVPRLKKTATNRDFLAAIVQQANTGNAVNGN